MERKKKRIGDRRDKRISRRGRKKKRIRNGKWER